MPNIVMDELMDEQLRERIKAVGYSVSCIPLPSKLDLAQVEIVALNASRKEKDWIFDPQGKTLQRWQSYTRQSTYAPMVSVGNLFTVRPINGDTSLNPDAWLESLEKASTDESKKEEELVVQKVAQEETDKQENLKVGSYHVVLISRGEYGEFSKIREEFEEAQDAYKRKLPVMLLLELSDMVGAMDGFLKKHHPSVTLNDLIEMHKVTAQAFESGARKAKE